MFLSVNRVYPSPSKGGAGGGGGGEKVVATLGLDKKNPENSPKNLFGLSR